MDNHTTETDSAEWRSFWFEGNLFFDDIRGPEDWQRLREAYPECTDRSLLNAKEATYGGTRSPQYMEAHPNFGFRSEHDGRTLLEFFAQHGMPQPCRGAHAVMVAISKGEDAQVSNSDLTDTVLACLQAAGAPEDLAECEREVSRFDKPSGYIRNRIAELERQLSEAQLEPAAGVERALDRKDAVGNHPLALRVQEEIRDLDGRLAELRREVDVVRRQLQAATNPDMEWVSKVPSEFTERDWRDVTNFFAVTSAMLVDRMKGAYGEQG